MKVYSRIFWHIQTYLNISKAQASSEASVTLAYLEPWYMQNKKHILSRDILRTMAYSELWYIQNPGIFKTLSNIYYGAFSQKQSTTIIIFITSAFQVFYFMKKYYFFNTGLICIPEVFIRCKVWGLREPGGGGREFLIDLFLELITVLVYGSKKAATRCAL